MAEEGKRINFFLSKKLDALELGKRKEIFIRRAQRAASMAAVAEKW